ncbi:MAG: putative ABC transporter permease subunit [Thermoanaerobaculia bacterium]
MWSLRIALSKLRPINGSAFIRIAVVAVTFALFLYGDYALFRRLFRATAQVEAATPFFALAILRNILAMVFLVATIVLFSSAMTAAIGAYFTDLDLDIYHSAPRSKFSIVLSRWAKTLVQSATVVFAFLIPLLVAFAHQYARPWTYYPIVFGNLALLLSIPVTLACLTILMLVRWFPVRRVHQIVATIAILVLSVTVVAFRVSRPERLFTEVKTDNLAAVLSAIDLPSIDLYPGTALAEVMVAPHPRPMPPRIVGMAVLVFLLFAFVAKETYFTAFVRARESMAPSALGAKPLTRSIDALLSRARPPVRALIAKEIRTLTRDVAQWSQLFMMAALLFIYLYNVRMLPLGGDARATIIAYANLGMAGFVVAAICLRFAYPSISAEGRAFWMLQVAPVSYRELLRVKLLVYGVPMTAVAVLLTVFANLILEAGPVVWAFTLPMAAIMAITLVSLGIGMGALSPNFAAENPLQVGLSLGGFAYMAVSLGYVGVMMLLAARPIMQYVFWGLFRVGYERPWLATTIPIAVAVTTSLLLAVLPMVAAEKRLARLEQTR